ncbi:unnamed protein product [Heligmosomoides polygyrus]|uniref:Flocculation protein FLO11-like n=1 Tax=Heligmosomoides polygyrus TaxID=6339 RepID=A0A183GPW5_HELPZ|nr:unnamed protein product [Heligmosomoides polygyrus]
MDELQGALLSAIMVICSLTVGSPQEDDQPSDTEHISTEAATKDVSTEDDTGNFSAVKSQIIGTFEPESTTVTVTTAEEVHVTEGSTSTTAERPLATAAPPQTQAPTGDDYPFVERFDDLPLKSTAASELLTHSAVVPLILILLAAL